MAGSKYGDPKRVEALLKLRQRILEEGMGAAQGPGGSAAALARPSLNSSVILKKKAVAEARAAPRVTEEEVQAEVRRLRAEGLADVDYGFRDTLQASMLLEENRIVNAPSKDEPTFHDLTDINTTVFLKARQVGKQVDPEWRREVRNKPAFDDPLLCPAPLYDYHIDPQPLTPQTRLTDRPAPARFAGPAHLSACVERELRPALLRAMPAARIHEAVLDARSCQARRGVGEALWSQY